MLINLPAHSFQRAQAKVHLLTLWRQLTSPMYTCGPKRAFEPGEVDGLSTHITTPILMRLGPEPWGSLVQVPDRDERVQSC